MSSPLDSSADDATKTALLEKDLELSRVQVGFGKFLRRKDAELASLTATLSKTQSALAHKEHELSSLTNVLETLNTMLADKEHELASLTTALAETKEALATKEQQLEKMTRTARAYSSATHLLTQDIRSVWEAMESELVDDDGDNDNGNNNDNDMTS